MADSVVKIDKELEKKIEELIKKEKYKYSSKKQVVNLAIIEFLNKLSFIKKKQNTVVLNKNKKKREK